MTNEHPTTPSIPVAPVSCGQRRYVGAIESRARVFFSTAPFPASDDADAASILTASISALHGPEVVDPENHRLILRLLPEIPSPDVIHQN